MFGLKIIKTEDQILKIGKRLGITNHGVQSLIKTGFLLKSCLNLLESVPFYENYEKEALRQLVEANEILYSIKNIFIEMPAKYKFEILKIEILLLNFSFPQPLNQKRNKNKIRTLVFLIERRILKYKICQYNKNVTLKSILFFY